MTRTRKNYTPEEKVAILRRHLVDHVPVSHLCEELNLQPSLFYRWQKEFFENGAAAFQSQRSPGKSSAAEKKVGELEAKLKRKNEVVAELMEEHIQLKKTARRLQLISHKVCKKALYQKSMTLPTKTTWARHKDPHQTVETLHPYIVQSLF